METDIEECDVVQGHDSDDYRQFFRNRKNEGPVSEHQDSQCLSGIIQ